MDPIFRSNRHRFVFNLLVLSINVDHIQLKTYNSNILSDKLVPNAWQLGLVDDSIRRQIGNPFREVVELHRFDAVRIEEIV